MTKPINKLIPIHQVTNNVLPETITNTKLVITLGVVLWAVFSLPSILFSQWFPLDEGVNFKIAQHFQEFFMWIISPYSGTGRYFPFYWMFNSFEFYLFGTNVAPYFFIQSIVFFIAAFLTISTLHKITGSSRSAALLLIGIYFSSPIAENLNTVGKAEPIIFLLMMCIVFAFCYTHVVKYRSIGLKTMVLSSILISILFALSIWTKETSIALFGFCVTGIISLFILNKFGKVESYTSLIKDYLYLLLALVIGFCISKVPYFIFPATLKTASYIDYAVTSDLISQNFLFYVQQQPDVIIFGVLALILLTMAGRNLFLTNNVPSQNHVRGYTFVLSLCAMAWAYYIVLLAWRWPMSYYMLLPAILFKLCVVYGLYITNAQELLIKPLRFVLYGVIALCTLYAAIYIYYISTSQITYSIVYSEALKKYVEMRGEKSSLVLESYPFYSEQVDGTWELLLVDTGTSFPVKGIADVLDPAVTSNIALLKLLNVSQPQLEENINNLPKQGDFLLVITGSKLATWSLRGVAPYFSAGSLLKTQGVYDMDLVAERQIRVPALYLHIWTKHLVAEETSIGYKLYKVIDNGPKFLWKGRYPDGWIGKEASLQVNTNYRRNIVIKFSAPNFALPNKVTIRKDGLFLKELEITDTNEKVLSVSDAVGRPTTFQFEIQNAIVPKNIKFNNDSRELGLRITLDTDTNLSR